MTQSRGEKAFQVINVLFLTGLSFLFVFPFWRLLALSFNEGLDASIGGVNFWPRKFTLANYAAVFSRSDILHAYIITIGRTVIGTTCGVLLISLMAYGLSKNRLRGRKIINVMLIFTMFFSGGLIPTYMLFRSLGLLNHFSVFIFPFLYNAAYVFIFRSFFRALPPELEESAQIDGASDLTVYLKIVLPLSAPIFATMALFLAVIHWNDYMTAVIYISNDNLLPLQTLLMRILNVNQDSTNLLAYGTLNLSAANRMTVTPQSIKMAALVVVVAPILFIYPFLQKYFEKGIIIGSLKG